MLPVVDFCGINITRLIIGANPFGGYSHQSEERDREMRSYYTVDRIKETWRRAEAAGINTMVTNNETDHVLRAVKEYLHEGGSLKWIAQLNFREKPDMAKSIDEAVEIGCKALFFHGDLMDKAYTEKNEDIISNWCNYARSSGVPVGVAGHIPEAHLWLDSLDIAQFHVVCFFNCGSIHGGKGYKFKLSDISKAVDCINKIQKPCIGYKIMGAGKIDPYMAFQYALENIKPADVVNVGMYRGDKDNMVEENVVMVEKLICS
jgi:hypothetical protein